MARSRSQPCRAESVRARPPSPPSHSLQPICTVRPNPIRAETNEAACQRFVTLRDKEAAREESSITSIPTAHATVSATAAARTAVPQSTSLPSTSDSALHAESHDADDQDVEPEVTNDADEESSRKRLKVSAAAITHLQNLVNDGHSHLKQQIPEAAPVLADQVASSQSLSASSSSAGSSSASASSQHSRGAEPASAAASASSSSSSSFSSSSAAPAAASSQLRREAPAPAAASSSSSSSASSASASSQPLHAVPAPAAASSSSSSSSAAPAAASNQPQGAVLAPASAAQFLSPVRQVQDWKNVLDKDAACWQLFQKHTNDKKTKCKACDTVYTFSGGNTTSMKDHIEKACKKKELRTYFPLFVSMTAVIIGLTRQKSIILSK